MPNQRTRFDKDLMKLDEQVNILHQVFNYQRIHIFPKEGDPNHKGMRRVMIFLFIVERIRCLSLGFSCGIGRSPVCFENTRLEQS